MSAHLPAHCVPSPGLGVEGYWVGVWAGVPRPQLGPSDRHVVGEAHCQYDALVAPACPESLDPRPPTHKCSLCAAVPCSLQGLCVLGLGLAGAQGLYHSSPLVARPEHGSLSVCHLCRTCEILGLAEAQGSLCSDSGETCWGVDQGQDLQPRFTKRLRLKLRDVPGLKAPRAEALAAM